MPNETLKTLLEVVSPKEQIADFVKSFKFAVETLNKMKAATGAELSQLRVTFDQAIKDLKSINSEDFKSLKVDLAAKLESALKEQQDGLNYMRDWVRNLPQAKDGENGVDGKDADEQAIVQAVLAQIPQDTDSGDKIIDKINAADKLIDASAIGGLEEALTKMSETATSKGNTPGWGAHPLAVQQSGSTKVKLARVINFTGATVTHSPQGVTTVAISAGGVNSAFNEVVAGNTNTFTLANTPVAGTERIYALGQRLVPTTDYTILNAVITTVNTWTTGQITADYNF